MFTNARRLFQSSSRYMSTINARTIYGIKPKISYSEAQSIIIKERSNYTYQKSDPVLTYVPMLINNKVKVVSNFKTAFYNSSALKSNNEKQHTIESSYSLKYPLYLSDFSYKLKPDLVKELSIDKIVVKPETITVDKETEIIQSKLVDLSTNSHIADFIKRRNKQYMRKRFIGKGSNYLHYYDAIINLDPNKNKTIHYPYYYSDQGNGYKVVDGLTGDTYWSQTNHVLSDSQKNNNNSISITGVDVLKFIGGSIVVIASGAFMFTCWIILFSVCPLCAILAIIFI